jgi:EAL domain-containing protein (putative c-di-GMP-specific phosphodiesterase class I)
MLATLPIDALKLDRNFIKYAFENGEEIGTRMLTAITELAGNLQVPIVAEGCEGMGKGLV